MKESKSKKKPARLIFFPLIILAAAIFIWIDPYSQQHPRPETGDAQIMMGTITQILEEREAMQIVEVEITKGPLEGEKLIIENDESLVVEPRVFEVMDKVMIAYLITTEDEEYFYITEYDRSSVLFWLIAIFAAIVILVASWQGIGSLIGLGLSFIVLFKFVLPQILNGAPPVTTAIIGSLFIIPIVFYSSHGFERKTTVAVLSTIITLIITGILATLFAGWANLTGLASAEASYLSFETAQRIDFRGLVLAGLIISVLGIMNDITISQASIVQELKQVKSKISFGELYFRAMRIGRDHIASMVNTLILVYTGVSLPLLLVFLDRSKWFMEVINYEFLTEEIIRTFVGSIGLVLAVPITTLLAAAIMRREKH